MLKGMVKSGFGIFRCGVLHCARGLSPIWMRRPCYQPVPPPQWQGFCAPHHALQRWFAANFSVSSADRPEAG
jgi:hypothetical protein